MKKLGLLFMLLWVAVAPRVWADDGEKVLPYSFTSGTNNHKLLTDNFEGINKSTSTSVQFELYAQKDKPQNPLLLTLYFFQMGHPDGTVTKWSHEIGDRDRDDISFKLRLSNGEVFTLKGYISPFLIEKARGGGQHWRYTSIDAIIT